MNFWLYLSTAISYYEFEIVLQVMNYFLTQFWSMVVFLFIFLFKDLSEIPAALEARCRVFWFIGLQFSVPPFLNW